MAVSGGPTGTTLVLVRHGRSVWNVEDRFQGAGVPGPGLDAVGVAQAERTAAWLAVRWPQPAALVRSDLARVVATAGPAERRYGRAAAADQRWREFDVGRWTGRLATEIAAEDPDGLAAFRGWQDRDGQPRHGGERFADLRARVCAALHDLAAAAAGGVGMVFTHGGCVRMAAGTILGGVEQVLAPVGNGSVTVIQWRERPRLAIYGSAAHLDVSASS